MLHPDLDVLIAHIRSRGMMAGLITNGYFLVPKRIAELNDAGLDFLQISIDNVEPDEVSKKSLRLLDKKLQHLHDHAAFDVNINSVLGGGIKNPEDARTINTRARELGFSTSIGIIHDGKGRLKPLGEAERKVFDEVSAAISGAGQVLQNLYSGIRSFQDNLADGKPNEWRCRAGARYLYICEDGLVHYCSQQRGYPGVPLEAYTTDDIRREFSTAKSCAPYCTVGCVHRVSTMDFWRSPQDAERREAEFRIYDAFTSFSFSLPLGLLGFLLRLAAALGLRPVLLEDVLHLLDDADVGDDDADFAPLVELEPPQALAADETALAVADDRADVEPPSRKLLALHVPLGLDPAEDPHVDAGLDALRDQPQHRIVAHLRVVDQELLARAADEAAEALARVLRADDETFVRRGRRCSRSKSAMNSLLASFTSLSFLVMTPKLRLLSMSRPVKLKP